MNSLQIGFIIATVAVPLLLWIVVWSCARGAERLRIAEHRVNWVFAVILVGAYGFGIYLQYRGVALRADAHLPLQLCDWAMVATVIALIFRTQTAFELAYCWGLAGTFQALLTPAIAVDGGAIVWCFLIVHSSIPAAVIWMLLVGRRPSSRAWARVGGWSQIYFVTAIVANAMTGANYGFLARRSDRPSLLDKFPNPPGGWLYLLAIDAFAMTLFALMILPWRAGRHASHDAPEREVEAGAE